MTKNDLIISGPAKGPLFVLAHGAGAPMDSDWMNQLTELLNKEGIRVVRFEFPYMAERRLNGKKRPPNKASVLEETWESVVSLFKNSKNIFIGGKSMGGRTASLVADRLTVQGVLAFGFPFHGPGKEPGKRLDSLLTLKTKSLFLQGTRDSMGNFEEVETYQLPKNIKLHWLEDGDHSLKPRKKSGFTLEEHLSEAAKKAADFIKKNSK